MATVPSPRTWATGDLFTEAIGNALRDTFNFLLNPPRAEVFINGTVSVPSGSTTWTVPWDTKLVDTDGMTTPSLNYLTVQTPGSYEVAAQFTIAANTTGQRVGVIEKNGTKVVEALWAGGGNNNPDSFGVAVFELSGLVVGDQIALQIYQSSGASLGEVHDAGVPASFMRLKWVGP